MAPRYLEKSVGDSRVDLVTRSASSRKSSIHPVIAIHGGAGTMSREGSTPEQQERYRAALRGALIAGHKVLAEGGEAMDAAVASVTFLEDCPLFNAGKGAVFNADGKNELEASIMLSRPPVSHPDIAVSRRGAAVALLTHVKNPAKLARSLYIAQDANPHATLSGPAAESIGEKLGAEMVDPTYFFTEHRWREHRRGLGLPETPLPGGRTPEDPSSLPSLDQMPTGTVGAVCLDTYGVIASVTSTGGLTNKLAGRLGDTPTFAAGFWAEEWKPRGCFRRIWTRLHGKNDRAVGVSGTGNGDFFLRFSVASTVAQRMKFLEESVSKASESVISDLKKVGGAGGVVAVDDEGTVAMPLNTAGMYRGLIRTDGIPMVAIFHDEILK